LADKTRIVKLELKISNLKREKANDKKKINNLNKRCLTAEKELKLLARKEVNN